LKTFDADRPGSGVAEWAEYSVNIQIGCANDCLYCYAAEQAASRYGGWIRREDWSDERLSKRATIKSYPEKKGVVMFPTTHDITPFNVKEYIRVAKLILDKGNQLLIVSKPRLDCIEPVIAELKQWRKQILFRFTIGTISNHVSVFWEPCAPYPLERIMCLALAQDNGYRTSVSIEPMLEGYSGTIAVVEAVREHVTDTIWIGKMNKVRLRVAPEHFEAVGRIETMQGDELIMKLYRHYEQDPVIRWKDSIKEVVGRSLSI
jgi:DNA repair photolyase